MSFLKINRALHQKVHDADIANGADKDEMHYTVFSFFVLIHCPGQGFRRERTLGRQAASAEIACESRTE